MFRVWFNHTVNYMVKQRGQPWLLSMVNHGIFGRVVNLLNCQSHMKYVSKLSVTM